jgi:hypothetical protein
MMDWLDEFLQWGPYGLYATLVLMLLALPVGWLYAYIAFVGKHRDITQPDPVRQKAAWGGAIIIAISIFVLRHLFVSDIKQTISNFDEWMRAGEYSKWMGDHFVKPVFEYEESFFRPGSNVLVNIALTLLHPFVILFVTVFMANVVIWGIPIVVIAVPVGVVVLFAFNFAFLGGALSAAAWCLPGFLIGTIIVSYFLFVRLPLQVVYRRAIREGRWPTTDELVRALAKGTLNKTDWQSKIMAHKSQRFEVSLDKEAARIAKRR